MKGQGEGGVEEPATKKAIASTSTTAKSNRPNAAAAGPGARASGGPVCRHGDADLAPGKRCRSGGSLCLAPSSPVNGSAFLPLRQGSPAGKTRGIQALEAPENTRKRERENVPPPGYPQIVFKVGAEGLQLLARLLQRRRFGRRARLQRAHLRSSEVQHLQAQGGGGENRGKGKTEN